MIKIDVRKKEWTIKVRGENEEHEATRKILDKNRVPFSVFVGDGHYSVRNFSRTYVLQCSFRRYICLLRALVRAGLAVEPLASVNLY